MSVFSTMTTAQELPVNGELLPYCYNIPTERDLKVSAMRAPQR